MKKLLFILVSLPAITRTTYEPFTIRDLILVGHEAASAAFTAAAYAKAMEAEDFKNSTAVRFKNLAQNCQTNSKSWSQDSNFIVERLLRIDLKDPKQVAALGLAGSVATIATIKLISAGIDWGVRWVAGGSKK